jgi:hypothetical protein
MRDRRRNRLPAQKKLWRTASGLQGLKPRQRARGRRPDALCPRASPASRNSREPGWSGTSPIPFDPVPRAGTRFWVGRIATQLDAAIVAALSSPDMHSRTVRGESRHDEERRSLASRPGLGQDHAASPIRIATGRLPRSDAAAALDVWSGAISMFGGASGECLEADRVVRSRFFRG